MKKLLAILLSVAMLLCLFTACDSKDDDDDKNDKGGKSSSTYETPVDRALKVMAGKGSKSDVKAMFPDEYWEEEDFDDFWAEYEDQLDTLKERMEEMLGSGIKYSYEITDKEELEGDELDEIKAELSEDYGIDEDDVEQAYNLAFDYTIEGSEDEMSDSTEDATVVCIRGEWYQYPF